EVLSTPAPSRGHPLLPLRPAGSAAGRGGGRRRLHRQERAGRRKARGYHREALRNGFLMAKKVRVLVADDSEIVREILVAALRRSGDLEVVGTASNGDEAAALTASLRPDVITMDLHMPGS